MTVSTWHMQQCTLCAFLLFHPSLPACLYLRLSSPVNTAGWLTGPLRALVAGWIKRWYKKRLKGRRKQWLLKGGEEGWGRGGTIDWTTRREQHPIRRRHKGAPGMSGARWEWVNPLVTRGSGSGHCRIKGNIIHTSAERPGTYLSASATRTVGKTEALTLLFVQYLFLCLPRIPTHRFHDWKLWAMGKNFKHCAFFLPFPWLNMYIF